MSTKELDRAAVMARLVERTLSQRAAAEVLQMTVRQVRRLQRAYESQGAFALVSKRSELSLAGNRPFVLTHR